MLLSWAQNNRRTVTPASSLDAMFAKQTLVIFTHVPITFLVNTQNHRFTTDWLSFVNSSAWTFPSNLKRTITTRPIQKLYIYLSDALYWRIGIYLYYFTCKHRWKIHCGTGPTKLLTEIICSIPPDNTSEWTNEPTDSLIASFKLAFCRPVPPSKHEPTYSKVCTRIVNKWLMQTAGDQ